jgi:hypothetical protein
MWCSISFTLVVDDFGIKYSSNEHVHHLIQVLKQDYQIEEDWGGTQYIGLTVDWDYKGREVHISMPGYIKKALAQCGHQVPKDPQHQPHKHTIPSYGATIQYAKAEDTSRPLAKDEKKYIQQIIGTFLYYGRAVDPTMLTSLSSMGSTQAESTEETMIKTHPFLDYVATHQDAIITYRASNMVLAVHSNASYLSKHKVRSQAGGHFFMSSNTNAPDNNGAKSNIAQLIKSVMSSAAKAKLGALYVNAGVALRASKKRTPAPKFNHKFAAAAV